MTTANECPPECQLDRDNIKEEAKELFGRTLPRWIQIIIYGVLISLIGTLFALVANSYLYATETYATKTEVSELKKDLKERMDDGFDRVIKAVEDIKK